MPSQPYWLRMRFPDGALAVVRAALKTKLWRGTPEERLEKIRALNMQMSEFYSVPVCTVTVRSTPVGPHYLPGSNAIVLDKVSLVSWAHEFGHHLLHCRRKPQQEIFPRAFSLSLFYQAAPRMFAAAREAGRLLYTDEGSEHAEQ